MAIGTPTSLGSGGTVSSAGSVAFTSGAAIPSGALAIVLVGWYGSTITTTLSGGGLVWGTADKTQQGASDTNYKCAIYSAQAPAGAASASAFTGTFSAAASNPMIAGFYCTGLASSSQVDATGGQNTTGTSTAWSSGNITNVTADALIVAGCTVDGAQTSTAGGGSTELFDFANAGAGTRMTVVYRVVAAISTYALSGTLSANNSLERVAPVVAYKATGGGGGVTVKQLAAMGAG